MTNILEVRQLRKHYPDVKAVNGVDFGIPEGICFGLLGPNGAGKTTTIEMMEGILKPSSGEIFYKGEPQSTLFKQEAGIQFQSTALQDYLTVRENLTLFQSLYTKHLPVDELIDICSLASFLDQDASKLSGGQRQRLLLAIALVNDPEIVFLDEPTTGLDPQARLNFWTLVKRIKARKKTVLLTTHYMEEAYNLCDEIAIMDHGKIIAHGTPDELLAEQFQDVVIELPKAALANNITELPYTIFNKDNGNVEISSKDVNSTLSHMLAQGISLEKVQVRSRTLEDLFIELTGKELRT
ncbi:MAG: ABC transporter, ATP-binding protein [uncultured Thiotrichaceae bacterium]|uniref:ABC transporter, ATP-binding protein n=1 Tax=uncultured Thiotrichaceae bacterium TaxID=298394 RepID=A0A6S6SZQ0_9GAMM|nr:MAG: ABC transporter, ATP-binding protein [uncultured Thiotrichaceae bacterium]